MSILKLHERLARTEKSSGQITVLQKKHVIMYGSSLRVIFDSGEKRICSKIRVL